MPKTVIQPRLSPADVKEMAQSDNKGVAVHRYSSFYYLFEVVEREKTFELGNVSIPKEDIEPLSLNKAYTQQNKHEPLGKFVSLLVNMESLATSKPEALTELGKKLQVHAINIAQELKIENTSYHSLLKEGLGSLQKVRTFDNNKVVYLSEVRDGPRQ